VTGLERRCRWLLHAYPAWYRRERSGEVLDTLLEASRPGRSWPSFRDARAGHRRPAGPRLDLAAVDAVGGNRS
jgi:hypothetical protein